MQTFFSVHRWLFRYVMGFMRDGTLPEDRTLLSQLYREAVFWNLSSMQRAIEEERVSVIVCVLVTCSCVVVSWYCGRALCL